VIPRTFFERMKIAEFKELKTFVERTRRSFEIHQRACRVIPMGVNSNVRFLPPHMLYPLYIDRAKGSRIWDADGNEYIDYHLGFGVLMAGHNHPKLVEALKERLDKGGITYGEDPVDAYEVAEELVKRFRLDMVRMSCTGSEATWLAIKLARAYTNRNKIIKFEGCYHGSNDYLYVSHYPPVISVRPVRQFHSLGVPSYVWKDTLIARYNDLNSVEYLFSRYGDDIAGLIVEPVAMNIGVIPPEPGFLEGLRRICDEHGAVLIFDEIKTGAKLAYGGAVEYFGVQPDLVTVAKAVASGLPFSAVVGKREIMELIGKGKVTHAGTFNANHLSVTAAKVTLKEILTPDVYEPARRLSGELAKGYQDILDDKRIDAVVQWIGVNGHIYTGITEPVKNCGDYYREDQEMWWRLAYGMMNRGIIIEGLTADDEWTVSVQHTRGDVEATLEAFKEVVSELTK